MKNERAGTERDRRPRLARSNYQARTGTRGERTPCSAGPKQDWQLYQVDPYSVESADHAYCRESADTEPVVFKVGQVTGAAYSGIVMDQVFVRLYFPTSTNDMQ